MGNLSKNGTFGLIWQNNQGCPGPKVPSDSDHINLKEHKLQIICDGVKFKKTLIFILINAMDASSRCTQSRTEEPGGLSFNLVHMRFKKTKLPQN